MFALGRLFMPFRSKRIVIVAMLLCFSMNSSFKRRDCSWNLIDSENTLRTGSLADDVQQLTRIGFEHDDVCSRLGFESIEHFLSDVDVVPNEGLRQYSHRRTHAFSRR